MMRCFSRSAQPFFPAQCNVSGALLRRVAVALVLGSGLVACGGGDSYEPTAPVNPVVDNFPTVANSESGALMRRGQQVQANGTQLEYGDTWMYQWVNKTTGTGYYSTHYLSALDRTTQLYSHTVTFSDDQPYQTRNFGSRNQPVAVSFQNTRCDISPQTRSPFPRRPYTVGATWSHVWSEACLDGGNIATTVDKTINGRVVALETLTLGLLGQGGVALGGTTQRVFQTARYTATRTETQRATGTWTHQDTCWHDIAQDRTVKCETTASFVPAGGAAVTVVHELTQQLAFVREVRTPSPVLVTDGPTTVAQYAGRWDVKLTGQGGSVTCSNMVISLTGNVSGNCVRVVTTLVTRPDPANPPAGTIQVPVETRTAFTVSGFVDRRSVTTQATGAAAVTRWIDAINIVADSNPNDLSMTGEMLSPIAAKGTWLGQLTSGGSNLEGEFAARHL
jgi:hypothetical protein